MTDLHDHVPANHDVTSVKKLAETAIDLIVRVRDDDPQSNAEWLTRILPDPHDWFRLAFVLAAAVPDDQPWSELTAWTRQPRPEVSTGGVAPVPEPEPRPERKYKRPLKPCGTATAAKRHRARREQICGPCLEAERAEDARKRKARAERREQECQRDLGILHPAVRSAGAATS